MSGVHVKKTAGGYMSSYDSHAKFLDAVSSEIATRYRRPAGALVTVAVLPVEGHGSMFATGKVVFHDEPIKARGAFTYPTIVLAEEWISDVEDAIERLRALLQGAALIAGQEVRGRFGATFD